MDKRASEEVATTVKKAGSGGGAGESSKRARAPSPEVDATKLAQLSKFKFKMHAQPDQCFSTKLGDAEEPVTYVAAVLKWGKDNEEMALNAPVVAKWSC